MGRLTPTPDRDPGLQPERTRLAWRRTTLTWVVVAILAARQVIGGRITWAAAPAIGLSVLALLGFLTVANRRIRAMGSPRPEPLPLRGALAAVACTLALAAFAVAIVV